MPEPLFPPLMANPLVVGTETVEVLGEIVSLRDFSPLLLLLALTVDLVILALASRPFSFVVGSVPLVRLDPFDRPFPELWRPCSRTSALVVSMSIGLLLPPPIS